MTGPRDGAYRPPGDGTCRRPGRDVSALDDPAFFRYWSELRHRIALAGKSVPRPLKREYDAVFAEFRRRIREI
jgi:hypothetical protein